LPCWALCRGLPPSRSVTRRIKLFPPIGASGIARRPAGGGRGPVFFRWSVPPRGGAGGPEPSPPGDRGGVRPTGVFFPSPPGGVRWYLLGQVGRRSPPVSQHNVLPGKPRVLAVVHPPPTLIRSSPGPPAPGLGENRTGQETNSCWFFGFSSGGKKQFRVHPHGRVLAGGVRLQPVEGGRTGGPPPPQSFRRPQPCKTSGIETRGSGNGLPFPRRRQRWPLVGFRWALRLPGGPPVQGCVHSKFDLRVGVAEVFPPGPSPCLIPPQTPTPCRG